MSSTPTWRKRRYALPAAGAGAAALVAGLLIWSPAGQADAGPAPGPRAAFTAVAAGDIAEQCTEDDSGCEHPRTAALTEKIDPAFVLTMGDNQYDDARTEDFEKYYAGTWGRFKDKTRPTAGNHETYDPDGALTGYKNYFGDIAYPKGEPYYSFDQDNWHFVALDSNSFDDDEQLTWLKEDLAANDKKCVAAVFHHPLFSSGEHGNEPVSKPVWDILYDNGAELILNGHDHHYERFAPQTPDAEADPDKGIVEVIGGVGGASPYDIQDEQPNSEKRISGSYGVLRMDFTDTGFSWDFVNADGDVEDSSPDFQCH
ncbi:metallophosphoesterase family protein [Streptomyces iconiensis]|uniref:Metallophosphoesterase n=1 Tax=Streptomyces iconiensis TaxID=1384038 RepID=A0ABT7A7E8_9ACTN|nr:metallophosphoesterase [Streptomyces iconiensis]MDJ1137251.1 metallophosphoesterase [Streptomyces iconiensis]